jgi:hypothetical protein
MCRYRNPECVYTPDWCFLCERCYNVARHLQRLEQLRCRSRYCVDGDRYHAGRCTLEVA